MNRIYRWTEFVSEEDMLLTSTVVQIDVKAPGYVTYI